MNFQKSEKAANYIYDILQEGEFMPLKYILKKIQFDYHDDCQYLKSNCKNKLELANFLQEYEYLFFLDNGKVGRYSDEFEKARESAVTCFSSALKEFGNPVHYKDLRKYLDKAPKDVVEYINKLYPEDDLKRFLKRRPNIFVVFQNDTVSLIEKESTKFFKKMILEFGDGVRFTNLRGHVGHAPEHVRVYINECYPGTEFRDFLENNANVFKIDLNGNVYLV